MLILPFFIAHITITELLKGMLLLCFSLHEGSSFAYKIEAQHVRLVNYFL